MNSIKINWSLHSKISSLLVILLAILINISSIPPHSTLVDNYVNFENSMNENQEEERNSTDDTVKINNGFSTKAAWYYHFNSAFPYSKFDEGILSLDVIVPPPERLIIKNIFIYG